MIERAGERRRGTGQPTIFFLDEIHRFNKAQQDALLPAVEEGLRDPDRRDHREPLLRGQLRPALAPPGLRAAAARSRRPGRGCCAARSATPSAGSADPPEIADDGARPARRPRRRRRPYRAGGARASGRNGARRRLRGRSRDRRGRAPAQGGVYDREGDQHYDYISAWIKATRGSDPDAALYYLAVMLEGGEDPRFIARRMVIFACEDVGNADPQALAVATAAAQAVDRVGLPECALNLAQAAVYLALAPKSNRPTGPAPPAPTSASTARSCRPSTCATRTTRARRARPRRGLRLFPRRPRRRRRSAVAAAGGAGRALLRAHRPRVRARAGRAARAPASTAGGGPD